MFLLLEQIRRCFFTKITTLSAKMKENDAAVPKEFVGFDVGRDAGKSLSGPRYESERSGLLIDAGIPRVAIFSVLSSAFNEADVKEFLTVLGTFLGPGFLAGIFVLL